MCACSCTLLEATKRPRMEYEKQHNDHLLSISSNACCVAFTNAGAIFNYALCPFTLGQKGEVQFQLLFVNIKHQ